MLGHAIKAVSAASSTRVAPHVAVALVTFAADDVRVLDAALNALTPAQLAGMSWLPDPLRGGEAGGVPREALRGATRAEERLLAIAAVSSVDLVDILLAASAVDIDALLSARVAESLWIRDGRFGFIDERVRSALLSQTGRQRVREAHGALARAARRAGQRAAAEWHAALAASAIGDDQTRTLVRIAQLQLERGATGTAQRVAEVAAESARGEVKAAALTTAARAALWSGHLDDATALATSAVAMGASMHARDTLRLAQMLATGAEDDPDPRRRVIAHYLPLRDGLSVTADRTAFDALARMAETWWVDPDGTDALQAQLTLASRHAHDRWPLFADTDALSPLAEAHVRLMQAAFQLQAGEAEGAAATLDDAAHRLPLAVPGAGVVTSLVEILDGCAPSFDGALSRAFAAVSPPQVIAYRADGPRTGERTSAASRLAGPARVPGATTYGLHLVEDLTRREHQIVELAVGGGTNEQIGQSLGISARTVEVHLTRIYRKAAVRTRAELLARLLGGAT